MKVEWLAHVMRLSLRPDDFYSGCRKIHQGLHFKFMDLWDAEDPLVLEDCGYTSAKMSHLRRLYLHEESRDMAKMLWDLRRTKDSYGSVCFTTFNHLLKNDITKKSKRASVMGPCLQSVAITQIKGGNKSARYSIDVFYRTTELLKKFPADLIFIRDVLLEGFNFEGMEFMGMTCHFANVTSHPQYYVTALAHWDDWEERLERIKSKDKYFFEWIVKWTARYLCDEHYRGIAKFAQAQRVKDDADARIKGKKRKALATYLRENHPGHRNAYVEPEGDDD